MDILGQQEICDDAFDKDASARHLGILPGFIDPEEIRGKLKGNVNTITPIDIDSTVSLVKGNVNTITPIDIDSIIPKDNPLFKQSREDLINRLKEGV